MPLYPTTGRAWPSLWAALCLGAWCSGPAVYAAVPEYAVKAALLYKIGKFVRWPAAAAQGAGGSFRVCVLGRDDFGENLDQLSGLAMQGQTVAVERYAQLETGIEQCQVIFVSRSEHARVHAILGALVAVPALTVSDMEDFAAAGGMVGLSTVEGHISFQLNAAASSKVGLQFAAQLLQLSSGSGNSKEGSGR